MKLVKNIIKKVCKSKKKKNNKRRKTWIEFDRNKPKDNEI
jgi:hypothetical protein